MLAATHLYASQELPDSSGLAPKLPVLEWHTLLAMSELIPWVKDFLIAKST